MMEIKNALIREAKITCADGFLTVCLDLDYDGSGQSFGGYVLYKANKGRPTCSDFQYTGWWLERCMQIAGVYDWKNMKGKAIRVKADYAKVHGIGHIIKDDWFFPGQDFTE